MKRDCFVEVICCVCKKRLGWKSGFSSFQPTSGICWPGCAEKAYPDAAKRIKAEKLHPSLSGRAA